MLTLPYCECEQDCFKRHSRHTPSFQQKSFKKINSQQSTKSFRNYYCTTNIRQESKKYVDLQSNLSTQFQLLQPNTCSYKQLLEVVLSTIHESALAKPAMLDFCLQLYANNSTLTDIRNFAEKCGAEDAINWYTKETFVYRCVNQTLRSGDIDKCYSLRFYIANLSAQLYTLKYQQQNIMEKAGMTILYRGFRQSDEELHILQGLIGRVVAVKSFMSTSRNKEIALTYASPSDGQAENSRPLLIEIDVDLSSPEVIAADITGMSNFNEECEVLFNIGSIFRIESLTFDESSNSWLCRFRAVNENLAHIQEFRTIPLNMSLSQLILYGSDSDEPKRHGHGDATSLNAPSTNQQKLGWLACDSIDWAYIRHIECIIQWQRNDIDQLMHTCERTLEIYAQVDVKDSCYDLQIASCMNNAGYISLIRGQPMQHINLFKASLNLRKKYLSHDHILLAQNYRNLGLAYANLRDYHTAFELHNRALNINQHASIAAQWSTVTTLHNMGDLCHRLTDYTGAIKYYLKAIDTYYKCLNFYDSTKS